MSAEARELGRAYISVEANLDSAFAVGAITADLLSSYTAHSGEILAELRFVHLNAHLQMIDILSPRQIDRYNELRGYSRESHRQHH